MTQFARERIVRLTRAIGSGPHSVLVDPRQHLRSVLVTLGDKAAVDLLRLDSKLGPRPSPRVVPKPASGRGPSSVAGRIPLGLGTHKPRRN